MALSDHLDRAERKRTRRRRRGSGRDLPTVELASVVDLRPRLAPESRWVSDGTALPNLGERCDAQTLAGLYTD